MRVSVRVQILWPMLSVVALAIVSASTAIVCLHAASENARQRQHLLRVVDTLTQGSFPLSEGVLRQMSGLSGGQFVALDRGRKLLFGTVGLSESNRRALEQAAERHANGDGSADQQATVELAGRLFSVEIVPVTRPAGTSGARWLLVLQPTDRWWSTARAAAYPVGLAGVAALLVVVVVTTALAERLLRPLRALGGQAARIADGCFQAIPLPRRDDEITDLVRAINRMTERLGHYEREVRRNEQLRTLGQLGAGMAHQLRNAATGARMAIELLQRRATDPADRESTDVALRQLRLMESYLRRFLALGQPRPPRHDRIDLAEVIGDVLTLARPACDHAGIWLSQSVPPEPVYVEGDGESLREMLMNLVLNAVDAVRQHGSGDRRVSVELERVEDQRARLVVKDTGPGPPAALKETMFEPFVTGQPEGTGLGLYVAARTAEDHGGAIRWRHDEGMTCFAAELPIVAS